MKQNIFLNHSLLKLRGNEILHNEKSKKSITIVIVYDKTKLNFEGSDVS